MTNTPTNNKIDPTKGVSSTDPKKEVANVIIPKEDDSKEEVKKEETIKN